jgi:hypothetical protein
MNIPKINIVKVFRFAGKEGKLLVAWIAWIVCKSKYG